MVANTMSLLGRYRTSRGGYLRYTVLERLEGEVLQIPVSPRKSQRGVEANPVAGALVPALVLVEPVGLRCSIR